MNPLPAAALAAALVLMGSPAMAWTAKPAIYDHAKGGATCLVVEYQSGVQIAAVLVLDVVVAQLLGAVNATYASLGVVTFEHVGGGSVHRGPLYAAVDDQRFAGEKFIHVKPEMLAALRSGERLYLSWSSHDGLGKTSAALKGFGEAYDECAADLERLLRENAP